MQQKEDSMTMTEATIRPFEVHVPDEDLAEVY
jgi:hypothetical protein